VLAKIRPVSQKAGTPQIQQLAIDHLLRGVEVFRPLPSSLVGVKRSAHQAREVTDLFRRCLPREREHRRIQVAIISIESVGDRLHGGAREFPVPSNLVARDVVGDCLASEKESEPGIETQYQRRIRRVE
jgi:hypothetical protein